MARVPAASIEKLFGMFTRGQVESGTPGIGLGLAICRKMVTFHGDRISATNASGGGAEFSVVLPRQTAPALEDEEI